MQLITGMNSRVGCAISIFKEESWNVQLMICLYGCSKPKNSFTYAIGKTPANFCKCGAADSEFKNLCPFTSVKEDCGLLNEEGFTTTERGQTTTDQDYLY